MSHSNENFYGGMWNSVPDPSNSYVNDSVTNSPYFHESKSSKVKELIKYENGSFYLGYTFNNKPHGVDGFMDYNNDKKKFHGTFMFGIPYSGNGWVPMKDNWFHGIMKDGYMKKGKLFWNSSFICCGEFYNNTLHGHGEMNDANTGMIYYGDWKMGNKHGNGTVYWDEDKKCSVNENLRHYKGNWINNKATGNGRGEYKDSKGVSGDYQGDYVDMKRHGNGKIDWVFPWNYKYSEDEIINYKGEWKNDVITGKGFVEYYDNKCYEGMLRNGKRDGYGVLIDGKRNVSGMWVNGKLKIYTDLS